MRLLLDSHTLLWTTANSRNMPETVRNQILSTQTFISIISLWKIAIKANLGKLPLPENFFETIGTSDYILLPLAVEHIQTLRSLPFHHRDPFDRMILAQAQYENLTLVSKDRNFFAYDVQLLTWN